MIPTAKPRRLLPFVLLACLVVFVVREPAKAAVVTTNAFNGLMTVADALVTFASGLG
ncbi:hypothetical protein [Streptosporangium sp. NPDC049644]|uniref:hypothetical protein n=1 Tax=Streptosporangium sp. NPDC049644 TaxID=3155507 RepID=UPI00343FC76A